MYIICIITMLYICYHVCVMRVLHIIYYSTDVYMLLCAVFFCGKSARLVFIAHFVCMVIYFNMGDEISCGPHTYWQPVDDGAQSWRTREYCATVLCADDVSK